MEKKNCGGCQRISKDEMKTVNEKLMMAAQAGRDDRLSDLLLQPDCDAKFKNEDGMTALAWAALNGHAGCVQLLLPVSDALMKNNDDLRASGLAAQNGHVSLAKLIDAHALAPSEMSSISSAIGKKLAPKKTRMRLPANGASDAVDALGPLGDGGGVLEQSNCSWLGSDTEWNAGSIQVHKNRKSNERRLIKLLGVGWRRALWYTK